MSNLTIAAALIAVLWPTLSHAQAPLFTDNFESYAGGQLLDLQWELVSGRWEATGGALIGMSTERGICSASASPVSGDQSLEVLVVPQERHAPGGWAAASLALWAGSSDFWRLGLVEGPDGRRYAELVEMRHGIWQAQNEDPTRLAALPDALDGFGWEFAHSYVLRLSIGPARIVGEVSDHATGAVRFRKGFTLPAATDAVRRGRPALLVDALVGAFDDLRVTGTPARPGGRTASGRRAAVLDTGVGDIPPALLEDLRQAFDDAGIPCRTLVVAEPEAGRIPPDVTLLVLPHTRRLPLGTVTAVDDFLRGGGRAIFLGGPVGQETLVRGEDRWLPVADALTEVATERVLIDFARESPHDWPRHKGPEEGDATVAVEDVGAPVHGRALRVHVSDLHSWDTLAKSFDQSPFLEDQTLTCFWARGDARTSHLVIEWRELDGSRWMAAVPLSRRWQRHVLRPEDFEYWPDNPSQGRGGSGDHFRPAQARDFVVGLAQSHAPIPNGSHTYWIADVGSAAAPFEVDPAPRPILEAVSPPYKTYVPGAARELVAAEEQSLVPGDFGLPSPRELRCAMPRARGLGLKKARPGRWLPLLIARDAKGQPRGAVCSLYWSLADPYPDAAWGALGIEDPSYLREHLDAVAPVLTAMGRRLLDGVFLAKAGADQFSYLPGQAPVLGGQVANQSGEGQELRLVVTVRLEDRDSILFRESFPLSAPPGALTGASARWARPVPPGVYLARCELRRGDELLDEVQHEFVCLPRPRPQPSDYVTVRGGDFWLADQRWHPHGINFWPSNATALESFSYWLHWLDPTNYDPEVIRRDIAALAGLRLNSVSIALQNDAQLPALNHFLFRCAEAGIRANVYVGGGHPAQLNPESVVALIAEGRLADDPTICAWDIAWEPTLGDHERRKQFDDRWAAWIVERYGSIERAERDWRVPAPRTEAGEITGPSQEQILNDGEHAVMVAAYRRFVDDLISKSYGEWARRVRAVDPHHLIGVRSGYGGTGQPGVDRVMPFDLLSGAKHLDFISPEGYGLGGPWESFERGGFTTQYGRFAGAGKPVFWAEFGMSLYPDYTPQRIEAQRLLYEHMYRMVIWSGANGSAGWWFPGGFRVGENSDYGIMNPDGSPRPSALEARKWAPKTAAFRGPPEPDYWITIDRDIHPRGYSQVWARRRDEYVQARRAGHFVGLRTDGTGADSTNCPMLAVGDTRADGTNPPKYLNAEFNYVRLRCSGGDWVDVQKGQTVTVPPRRRVELVVSVGNTGEARWVNPAGSGSAEGSVFLVSAPGSDLAVREPLPGDVPRYSDAVIGPFVLADSAAAATAVALRLDAQGRTPFGEQFWFRVEGVALRD